MGCYEDPAGWVRRVAVNRLLNVRRDGHRREAVLAGIRPVDETALDVSVLDLRRELALLPCSCAPSCACTT